MEILRNVREFFREGEVWLRVNDDIRREDFLRVSGVFFLFIVRF